MPMTSEVFAFFFYLKANQTAITIWQSLPKKKNILEHIHIWQWNIYHLVLWGHGQLHEILARVPVTVAGLCLLRPAPQTPLRKIPPRSVLLGGPVLASELSHLHVVSTLYRKNTKNVVKQTDNHLLESLSMNYWYHIWNWQLLEKSKVINFCVVTKV